MDKKSVDRWTDDEVQALLGVFAEEDIQQQLAAATRNDKVYAKISARLGELNIHRSSKQVREKLKKLKQDYRRIKNHNSRNGSDRRSGKWFDRLDAVLGQRLFYSDTADTKDTVLLEPIRDETETEESNEAEEDREEVAELSAAPMAKRPCQCCCQTYSEILSFLEKRSEAEQRLREDEFALRREEIEIQRSKIALERERLADERKERERRFELESQERQVILGLLKEKVLKG